MTYKIPNNKEIETEAKEETIKAYIERLSKSKTTTADDDKKFQVVCRLMGFENAVVTCGVVYLDGQGTIQNPPRSIQQVASSMLIIIEEKMNKGN